MTSTRGRHYRRSLVLSNVPSSSTLRAAVAALPSTVLHGLRRAGVVPLELLDRLRHPGESMSSPATMY